MSNEITMSGSFRLSNGDIDFTRRTGTIQQNQAAQLMVHNVQDVGDLHEALDMGDVTGAGAFMFFNLDAVFTLSVGIDDTGSFVSFFDIPPGGYAMGSNLGTNAPYAMCNDSTGAHLEYIIAEK